MIRLVTAEPNLGKQLLSMGWRGGSVFHTSVHEQIAEAIGRQIAPDDWVVVISQTCDIAARTVEQEPVVEILICTPVAALRGGFKNLRSTRRLDFRPNAGTHPQVTLSVHATADRFHFPRSRLLEMALDNTRSLSATAYRRITSLYSLRYTRPAWPDRFVERLDPAKSTLQSALRPLGDEIAEVRISITPPEVELDSGEAYSVALFFVVDEQVWNSDPSLRQGAQAAYTKFVAALRACTDIHVNEELSAVLSGTDFSWQLTQQTDLWNFAFLSNRDSE